MHECGKTRSNSEVINKNGEKNKKRDDAFQKNQIGEHDNHEIKDLSKETRKNRLRIKLNN